MIIKHQKGFIIYVVLIVLLTGGLVTKLLLTQIISSSSLYQNINNYKSKANTISALEDIKYQIKNLDSFPSIFTCNGFSYSYQNSALGLNYLAAINGNSTPNPKLAFSTLSAPLPAIETGAINLINSSVLNSFGIIKINNEQIYYKYNDITNNRLLYLTRGFNETFPQTHPNDSSVGQYDCLINIAGTFNNQSSIKKTINAPLDLFATVGNTGKAYLWNYPIEKQWNENSVTDGTTLNALSLINYTDGFAVGDSLNADLNIKVWDLATTSWLDANPNLGLDFNLQAVSTVSSSEAWAVGARDTANYTLIKYFGGSATNWCLVPTNPSGASTCSNTSIISSVRNNNRDLFTIKVIDNNNDGAGDFGFAGGGRGREAHIIKYDSSTNQWSDANLNAANSGRIYAIDIVKNPNGTPLEAYAVGRGTQANTGVLLKWIDNTDTWEEVLTNQDEQLNDISLLDLNKDGIADFGMAVGRNGFVLIYDGSTWTQTAFGTRHLNSVKIISPNNVWVAGRRGDIYHYNGVTATLIDTGINGNEELLGIS